MHSVGAVINPYNPESLASLSQMPTRQAILGNNESVLNPGYMPPEGRQNVYNFGLRLEATVETPADQEITLQRLEQLNQTVNAALQAGRTAAAPSVAASAAESRQLNFSPSSTIYKLCSKPGTRDCYELHRSPHKPD